ncbi:MAG TPA: UxaA family hydrolase, partial [Flavisolibacter sp.]|nr:UxaA family hydrolase [Flavisolibacter sp.]
MKHKITKVHPEDNVLVALTNLEEGEHVTYNGTEIILPARVPAKHKFVVADLQPGDEVKMYGVLVGKAQKPIAKGNVITTSNLKHAAEGFEIGERKTTWHKPDISKFQDRTFLGYRRPDGKVGTANYWLVVPLVFCENRNLDVLREALLEELGYSQRHQYK